MRFRSGIGLGGLLCLATTACHMSHLAGGQAYLSRGNYPLAVEYFDEGLQRDPKSAVLRDALILSEQMYQWQLRDEIDRLIESGAYLLAITKLLVLDERARRMSHLQLPGEELTSLRSERAEVTKKAQKRLFMELDSRANRSRALRSDLRTCRQLQALEFGNELLQRRCDRLLKRLKLNAAVKVAANSSDLSGGLVSRLRAEIHAENPELIEVLDTNSDKENAYLHMFIGEARSRESGWFVSNRSVYRRWIEKRDSRGKLIKKKVWVSPSEAEKNRAKKEKRPPPKATQKLKQVYEQVRGEYVKFQSTRSVAIPYRIRIENLREQTIVTALEGTARSDAQTFYYKFRGDPRAAKPELRAKTGRNTAAALPSSKQLTELTIRKISSEARTKILERLE
jgi:hypothetical protein